MVYDQFYKTPDKKLDSCKCGNNHIWNEYFYRYPPGEGNYEYGRSEGSICHICGEQDIVDH